MLKAEKSSMKELTPSGVVVVVEKDNDYDDNDDDDDDHLFIKTKLLLHFRPRRPPGQPHRKTLGTCNIITLFLNPVRGKTSDATPAPEGHSVLDIFLLFSFIFLMPKSNPTS